MNYKNGTYLSAIESVMKPFDDLRRTQESIMKPFDDLRRTQESIMKPFDDLRRTQESIMKPFDDLRRTQAAIESVRKPALDWQKQLNPFKAMQVRLEFPYIIRGGLPGNPPSI